MRERKITNPATGETKTLAEWADCLGISKDAIKGRVKRSPYELKNVFDPPLRDRNKNIAHPITGESRLGYEWATLLDISKTTFYGRLKKYGRNDPKCFEPRDARLARPKLADTKLRDAIADRNNAKRLKNPRTGESLLLCEWADRFEVSLGDLYKDVKIHGEKMFDKYRSRW